VSPDLEARDIPHQHVDIFTAIRIPGGRHQYFRLSHRGGRIVLIANPLAQLVRWCGELGERIDEAGNL